MPSSIGAPVRVKMILPALTEATSPYWRPIKYSLFPPLGLATLAGYLNPEDEVVIQDEHVERLDLDDEPDLVPAAERGPDPASRPGFVPQAVRHRVEEGLAEGQGEDDAGGEAHFLPRRDITFCMSSQTMRRSSRLPSFRMR